MKKSPPPIGIGVVPSMTGPWQMQFSSGVMKLITGKFWSNIIIWMGILQLL